MQEAGCMADKGEAMRQQIVWLVTRPHLACPGRSGEHRMRPGLWSRQKSNGCVTTYPNMCLNSNTCLLLAHAVFMHCWLYYVSLAAIRCLCFFSVTGRNRARQAASNVSMCVCAYNGCILFVFGMLQKDGHSYVVTLHWFALLSLDERYRHLTWWKMRQHSMDTWEYRTAFS